MGGCDLFSLHRVEVDPDVHGPLVLCVGPYGKRALKGCQKHAPEKKLKRLSLPRQRGTPMMAHLQLPDYFNVERTSPRYLCKLSCPPEVVNQRNRNPQAQLDPQITSLETCNINSTRLETPGLLFVRVRAGRSAGCRGRRNYAMLG